MRKVLYERSFFLKYSCGAVVVGGMGGRGEGGEVMKKGKKRNWLEGQKSFFGVLNRGVFFELYPDYVAYSLLFLLDVFGGVGVVDHVIALCYTFSHPLSATPGVIIYCLCGQNLWTQPKKSPFAHEQNKKIVEFIFGCLH